MGAQADLEFSCAPDDCWVKIKELLEGIAEDAIKGDVADLKGLAGDKACELIHLIAICSGITDQCVLATLQAACGIATKDLGTAAAGGAGMGANCICPNFDLPTYKPSEQTDFGAFDGEAYYSGPATFGKPQEQPSGGESSGGDCEPGLHPARDLQLRAQMETLLVEFQIIPVTDEMRTLAEKYLRAGAFTRTMYNDAVHVAAATLSRQDVLVSWNFKPLVNRRRRRR